MKQQGDKVDRKEDVEVQALARKSTEDWMAQTSCVEASL
jgi:hypothetical protein